MYVLAVDPGKKAGWAIYRDGEYSRSGAMQHGDDVLAIADLLDNISYDVLVIEAQYLPRGRQRGIITLIKRRVYWQALALERRKQVVEVAPATWQAYYRRANWETIASSIAGRALASRDEAAAVCIGWWYCWTA